MSSETGRRRLSDKGLLTPDMDEKGNDHSVLKHIQRLVAEEHRLFERGGLRSRDNERLAGIQVQLDQCWDLLRQRRALREMGQKVSDAHVRPPEIVERYVG